MKIILTTITLVIVFVLGSFAQSNIPQRNTPAAMGTEVNTFSGNLFLQKKLFEIPGEGTPLRFRLAYNSDRCAEFTGVGQGWTMNHNLFYQYDVSGNAILDRRDGRRDTFKVSGSVFSAQPGNFDKVNVSNDTLRNTLRNGTKYEFGNDTHKKITQLKDRRGTFLNYSYTAGRLITVTDNYGRSITLGWAGTKLRTITEWNSAQKRVWVLSYSGTQLTRVAGPGGRVWQYAYDADNKLTEITDPRGKKAQIGYYPNGAVSEVGLSELNVLKTFSYNVATNITTVDEAVGAGTQTTTYEYDAIGRLTRRVGNCCGYDIKYEYDASNNITKITDAANNATTFTYDANGNMLTETDPLSNVLTYTYDPIYNQVTTFTNKSGKLTTNTYDASGNIIQTDMPAGVSFHYGYDALGRMVYETNGKGDTTKYAYDAFGNKISETYPDNSSRTFTYDGRGNRLSETDPNGNTTTFEYDILDRLVTQTTPGPVPYVTQYEYDANDNLTAQVDPNGNATTYTYDALNRVITETQPLSATYTNTYDQRNLISETNANGNTTTYTYDGSNRLTGSTTSDGTTVYAYDVVGNILSITDPLGGSLAFTYDALRRVVTETDPDGATTTFAYDASNNLISQTLPSGNIITSTYDDLGRKITTSDLVGLVSQTVYDLNNNPLQRVNGEGGTTLFTYDNLDRKISEIDPEGNITTFTYDDNRNLLTETDPLSNVTQYAYDGLDRRIREVTPLLDTIKYTYDGNRNLTSIEDGNGNSTTYTYDVLNRLTTESFSDSGVRTYGYDAEGNLVTRIDQNGATTTYTYDALNRLTSRDYPGTTDDETFTYDAAGRQTGASKSGISITRTYFPSGLINTETRGGLTTTYAYDKTNGTRTLTYPNGRIISEQLDERLRIDSIYESGTYITRYTYDLANRISSRTCGNGNTSAYAYDDAGNLTQLTHNNGINFWDGKYQYDATGNRTSLERIHRLINSEQYLYDGLGRLTESREGVLVGSTIPTPTSTLAYALDPLGNRTTFTDNGAPTTYTTNTVNEYTAITSGGTLNPTYDDNGSLTFDGTNYFFYDYENRLTKISSDAAGLVPVGTYSYDALGRRSSKTVGGTATEYYYDDTRVIEARTGATTTTFVYGVWLDDRVQRKQGATTHYFHADGLGSVVTMTDVAGLVVEHYEYDPYGEVSFFNAVFGALPASSIGNDYLYTGRSLDTESGLYHYRARQYDPVHGRFLQRDPLGYADGLNLYEYTGSNPVNYIDPNGTRRWGCSSGTCDLRKYVSPIIAFAACLLGIDTDLIQSLKDLLYTTPWQKFFDALKKKAYNRAADAASRAIQKSFADSAKKSARNSLKRQLKRKLGSLIPKLIPGAGTAFFIANACACAWCTL